LDALGWTCIEQPVNGRVAWVGPDADLGGADLTGTDLSGLSLENARLDGLRGFDLVACPRDGGLPVMEPPRDCVDCRSVAWGWDCLEQPETGRWALVGPGANLSGANLQNAVITNRDLRNADLSYANLEGANFGGTPIGEANLWRARVTELRGCAKAPAIGWTCAYLRPGRYAMAGPGVDLSGTHFTGASYDDLDLSNAMLRGVSFRGWGGARRSLKRVNFSNTDLTVTAGERAAGFRNFIFVDLTDANFTNARMPNADFQNSDLTRVDFSGANLSGASLTFPIEAGFISCNDPCGIGVGLEFIAGFVGITAQELDNLICLGDRLRVDRPVMNIANGQQLLGPVCLVTGVEFTTETICPDDRLEENFSQCGLDLPDDGAGDNSAG